MASRAKSKPSYSRRRCSGPDDDVENWTIVELNDPQSHELQDDLATEESDQFKREALDSIRFEVHDLERQLKEARDHSKSQSRTILQLKQKLAQLQGSEILSEQDQQSYKGLIEEVEEEGNRLPTQVDHLRRENEQLTYQLMLVQKEAFQASQDLTVSKNEREQLEASLAKMGTVMGTLSDANSKLQKDMFLLEKRVQTLQDEVQEAKSEAETANAQALIFKADFEEERKDREKAHSNMADFDRKIAQTERIQMELQQELRTKNEQLRELELAYEKSQETVKYCMTEASKLKEEANRYETQLKESRAEATKSKNEAETLRQGYQSSRRSNIWCKHECDSQLHQELKKVRSEKEMAAKSNHILERDLRSCQEEKSQLSQKYEKQIKQLQKTTAEFVEATQANAELRISKDNAEFKNQLETVKTQTTEHCEKTFKQFADANQHLQQQIEWLERNLSHYLEEQGVPEDVLSPYEIKGPVQPITEVGRGSYATAHTAVINRNTPCIIKKLHGNLAGRQNVSVDERTKMLGKFQKECVNLCQSRHPCIVRFMGVKYEQQDIDIDSLVMEQLPTDLDEMLAFSHRNHFDFPISYQISILFDVCCGLVYLHGRSILHRDLKAQNVLITFDMRAKLADLGESKLIRQSEWRAQVHTQQPGSLYCMPPEALCENPNYNEKLDVFSFGVLALHVAVLQTPLLTFGINVPDRIVEKGEEEIFKRQKWIKMVKENHPFYSLIHRCLLEKTKRPTTGEMNYTMTGLKETHPCTVDDTLKMFAHYNDLLADKSTHN